MTLAPLRSHARCCDAGSGVVCPACMPVSAVRCQIAVPGDVSPACPRVSQSLRSDARCCDAGSGVVSPACPRVSQSVRLCLPPVSLACLPVSPSLCGKGWSRAKAKPTEAASSLRVLGLTLLAASWLFDAQSSTGSRANPAQEARNIDSTSQQEPLATMFRNGERACRRFCC